MIHHTKLISHLAPGYKSRMATSGGLCCPHTLGVGWSPPNHDVGVLGWHLACNIDEKRIERRQGCTGQRHHEYPVQLPLISLSGGFCRTLPGVGRLIQVCCSLYKLTALACLVLSDSQSHTCICEAAADIQGAQRLQSVTGPPGWIVTRHLHAACMFRMQHHRVSNKMVHHQDHIIRHCQ